MSAKITSVVLHIVLYSAPVFQIQCARECQGKRTLKFSDVSHEKYEPGLGQYSAALHREYALKRDAKIIDFICINCAQRVTISRLTIASSGMHAMTNFDPGTSQPDSIGSMAVTGWAQLGHHRTQAPSQQRVHRPTVIGTAATAAATARSQPSQSNAYHGMLYSSPANKLSAGGAAASDGS